MWEERFLVGVSCLRARACCHCAFFFSFLSVKERYTNIHPPTCAHIVQQKGKRSSRVVVVWPHLSICTFPERRRKRKEKKKKANDRHSVHLLGSSSSPPLLLPYSLAIPTLRRVLLSSEAHLWLHIPTGTRGY